MVTTEEIQADQEIRDGERFEFGSNWRRFLSVLDDERILEAEKSLKDYLQTETLVGKTFLDIGSGSGLFSLAARRMGARVLSFDYDPKSVACTETLRRRYMAQDPDWQITQGSVLDSDFLKSLGQFDIVYCWGVLHHTGDMWRGLENVKIATKPGGKLFIVIYNDCGAISTTWLARMKKYNSLPRALRLPYALQVWAPIELGYFRHYLRNGRPKEYFDLWRNYKKSRGMSRWHDMIDWLGGYPYEFTSAERLIEFFRGDGFAVSKSVPNNEGYGCHQIVFVRA
jgi:2-polyprenyl-3-methyl-5-hydroxy-6-metoxy-1,4-benzoquinol methylase